MTEDLNHIFISDQQSNRTFQNQKEFRWKNCSIAENRIFGSLRTVRKPGNSNNLSVTPIQNKLLMNKLRQCSHTRRLGFRKATVWNTMKSILHVMMEESTHSNLPQKEGWEILWDTTVTSVPLKEKNECNQ